MPNIIDIIRHVFEFIITNMTRENNTLEDMQFKVKLISLLITQTKKIKNIGISYSINCLKNGGKERDFDCGNIEVANVFYEDFDWTGVFFCC